MTKRREMVELHSIESVDFGWELRIYQSPRVLALSADQVEIAGLLKSAAGSGQSIELLWDDDTGTVQQVFAKS